MGRGMWVWMMINEPVVQLSRLPAALGLVAAIACSLGPLTANAEDIAYPADSGVINVKTAYGAKGDGSTDDTRAILRAIQANIHTLASGTFEERILYFPNGTYLVSSQLVWQDAGGNWGHMVSFQGESEAGTVIKLKDHAAGFSDSANPKAVIYTASPPSRFSEGGGEGNGAFSNNICNLTVDTGRGNPGAVGIDYLANNQGLLQRVTIKSGDGQGSAGLAMTRRYVGPLLVKYLTVQGFDLGISIRPATVTLEHITLRQQNVAGLRNDDCAVSIRDLISVNSVPAIVNIGGRALLALIGGQLTGGTPASSAIINGAARANGSVYLRDITSSGYKSAVTNRGGVVPGASLPEWVSDPVLSLFPSPQTSLNLPIQEAPEFDDYKLSDWANIQGYGAVPNGNKDCTAAIQAAVDSGKPVIYFPLGRYQISDTIHVRGNVRKLIGFGGGLQPAANFPLSQPAFRFESTTPDSVTFERIALRKGPGAMSREGRRFFTFPFAFYDASPKPLVIRDVLASVNYASKNQPGAGPLFLEDVCSGPFNFDHQTVWARQLDPETTEIHLVNKGGKAWILGLKTEMPSTIIQTTGGGQTELLGADIYPYSLIDRSIPAFVCIDSSQSLVYGTHQDYEVNVQETRGGVTRSLYRAQSSDSPRAYPRYSASAVPLFVGYTSSAKDPVPAKKGPSKQQP